MYYLMAFPAYAAVNMLLYKHVVCIMNDSLKFEQVQVMHTSKSNY